MKKLLAVMLVIFLSLISTAAAQEVEMKIRLNDGSELHYNVDDIQWMRGTGVEYPWKRVVEFSLGFQYGISEPLTSLSFYRRPDTVFLSGLIVGSNHIINDWRKLEYVQFNLLSEGQNITALPRPKEYGTEIMTAWHDSMIYGAHHFLYRHDLSKDSSAEELPNKDRLYFNIELNNTGEKVLYSGIDAHRPNKLVERDLKSDDRIILQDSMHITCARYVPGTEDIIFYSFEGANHEAGYYKFNRSTKDTSLILRHRANTPDEEKINGFDISHDGKTLLIPAVRQGRDVTLVEYNLDTKTSDTLLNYRHPAGGKSSLWVQYSNDDSLILYSLSYFILAPSPFGDQSEVGIIDKGRRTKRRIHVAPDNSLAYSVPYPRWSPDNTAICYGAASIPVNPFDSIDSFYIYIKRLDP